MGRDETPELRLAKKKLTAEAARKITNETVTPLIHIYDVIKELATEGSNRLIWDAELDDVARNNIIKQLELDGYTVEKNNPAILDIRW